MAHLVEGDRDRLFEEERELCRRHLDCHLRMQIAAGPDHDAVQLAGPGQQFVRGTVEASIGEEGIVACLDAVAARVGGGRYLVWDVENVQPFGHV